MNVQVPAAAAAPQPAAIGRRAIKSSGQEDARVEADSASTWNSRGNALFRQGAVEEAVEAYNRAIKLNPVFGWPYGNLALAYLTQGQFAEALHLYQKSLELLQTDEDRAVSWNGLGNVYRCANDYANAVAAYQKAAELDPLTAGMRDGTDYSQTSQDMTSAPAWNELGEAFLKSGAFHEALRAFRKAVDLQPEVGWPYVNLAGVLAALGQHSKAVPFYQKALALLPGEKEKALVWNRLGNAYRKLNDYESAMKAYQQAVVLAGEGQTVLSRARFSLLSNLSPE
jgi:superkiller protein 3